MSTDIEGLLSLLQGAADCRRRRVAAVLEKDGEVVGRGWNGLRDASCGRGECPRGLLSYEEQPALTGYAATGCTALHAEVSAMLEAGELAQGATMHVTCEPCEGCAVAMIAGGVEHVVVHPASTETATAARP